jgi:hypothetical protein
MAPQTWLRAVGIVIYLVLFLEDGISAQICSDGIYTQVIHLYPAGAIDVANAVLSIANGGMLYFSAGVYPMMNVTVTKNVTFCGTSSPSSTSPVILKCSGHSCILLEGNAVTEFSNLTFTNGAPALAITALGHQLIRSCKFVNNSNTKGLKGDGGAIYSAVPSGSALLTIVDTVFLHNQADRGGALFAQNTDVFLTAVLFSGNRAIEGGAVLVVSLNPPPLPSLLLVGCSLVGNDAEVCAVC